MMTEIEKPRITFRTMLAECERELKLRRGVYSRRVEAGQMEQKQADWQIELMAAIADHFRPLAAAEQAEVEAELTRLEPRLF
jgi:hypothetical protein